MIVVDIGCMTHPAHPEDESQNRLIERFRPEVYYGFDPHPDTPEHLVSVDPSGTRIEIRRAAAWTFDGLVGLSLPPRVLNPLRTCVDRDAIDAVECFDLARWLLEEIDCVGSVVLKMDCEGAEYELIPHLTATGAFNQVSLLLVEFHGDQARPSIPVPWEPW